MDEREPIIDAVRRSGMSDAQTWIQYFASGGSLSELEVAAYLEGETDIAPHERDLLAEVAREAPGLGPRRAVQQDDGAIPDFIRLLGAPGSAFLDAEAAERGRLESLEQLHLLDTPAEERFDAIVRRVAERFGCEIATLALIARHRQFIKSSVGEAHQDLDRTQVFCNATIRSSGALVVPDTLEDPRFRSHPFVAGAPHIRFYAGHPLRGPGGWLIGTICVMSLSPRPFTPADHQDLEDLAQEMQHEVYPGWKAWRLY
ncbi:GAF domain-containing protein [Arthrobacter antioxidans]|uniref:GAF domain-containing protein n=1 Tax=Arthrobacter antioxidans TaxID=2895818 RepID=UPI001FFFC943|nr:GAF domain-containing protein [Arthrobacter antioxidans]